AGVLAVGIGGAYAYGKIRDAIRAGADERGALDDAGEPAQSCDDATSRTGGSAMPDGIDHYKILGVQRSASLDEIEAAYRDRALKHHPDRGGDAWAFQQVQAAYEQIGADISRRAWPPSTRNPMTVKNRNTAVAEIMPAVRSAAPVAQEPVAAKPQKSAALAILLAFFFGPLGMLYSDVRGAVVLFIVDVILLLPTLGLILLITWPIGVAWAAIATNNNSG
ncbi:MAG: J domain-containing protein, partial [Pirellulales bacterium]